MLFAQLTHAIGLNDVCDALRLHSGPLSALRGATPPSRNNLSHANKRRDAAFVEGLFWAVLDHLQKLSPGFAAGRRSKGLARRFRRVIHVVDSSTIALIASCIDWAQHRRRKAAAKLHVRLDLHSLLPRFVLVESAKAADSIRAAEICAGVKPGEIVIFDRAYVDFVHLGVLNGEKLTCGICLDSVGQQVDISDTSPPLSTPIFRDLVRAVGQRHSNYTQKKIAP